MENLFKSYSCYKCNVDGFFYFYDCNRHFPLKYRELKQKHIQCSYEPEYTWQHTFLHHALASVTNKTQMSSASVLASLLRLIQSVSRADPGCFTSTQSLHFSLLTPDHITANLLFTLVSITLKNLKEQEILKSHTRTRCQIFKKKLVSVTHKHETPFFNSERNCSQLPETVQSVIQNNKTLVTTRKQRSKVLCQGNNV